jgi:hypothetical protein
VLVGRSAVGTVTVSQSTPVLLVDMVGKRVRNV